VPTYDLVIVGGGAAGSEAAFTAADGDRHRILLVESSHFGGTCTNHGCVPTKALVRAAKVIHTVRTADRFGVRTSVPTVDWPAMIGRAYEVRDHMLRFGAQPYLEAGIEVRYPAWAVLAGQQSVEVDGQKLEARALILAAGLDPAVPPVPGLREAGYLDNESALELRELPGRMVVLGCGPIGAEFAQIFSRLGVRVTIIEALDQLLAAEEVESSAALKEVFSEEGIEMRLGARVEGVERVGAARRLHLAGGETIDTDEILVAAGRSLDGERLGLGAAGIEWTPKGVTVDEQLRTSQPWAWAAGDVVGQPLFTHAASLMGQVAARNAVHGTKEALDLRVLPRVSFTDPEVASVGMTQEQARQAGREVRVGFASLVEAEKAQIDGQKHGHVKVIADSRSGEMLGCHIVAETAGDMIHEAVAIMAGRVPVRKVAGAMHAYPTLSELMRSALAEAAG
jgi:pyruvate/2-oxoglutarate dehydrogenase complex dihydrolipoamide dehydrogenase (E3) component